MPKPLAAHPRAAHNDLAHGSPLAALRAHSAMFRAPRRTAEIEPLRSVVDSGDRLARALAIRLLARFAGFPLSLPEPLISGQSPGRAESVGSVNPFPTFLLEDADARIVRERDLVGHPAVVYLARHPG